ncbi:DegT/DnrJ/EryC1/StrS family aminotransferase [Paenibacillus cymbidii]|uniref:DegT/DnrJ/EryC1/StrS family aminotransferase n=1 Tax=Paenibacillus cymbidii TaxID=1639034 RepID=UPI001436C344|nr:DegT/DnrJ/EryC1/StrS family aminotransferase [Paenibacillus cymbidii]
MDNNSLAIYGGKPARCAPLPPNYPGAMLMGREEADEVAGVLQAQSPFRYYGPNLQYKVRQLEQTIATDMGIDYALGVTSCTAALITALKALGIGYGDKVIVPAVTWIATAGAVVCSHAVPVFADVDDSLNLDPDRLEEAYDDEVKAIIAVPLLGNACEMDAIMSFARRKGIYVIEDVAQSLGTRYKGRLLGTIGDIGVLSFQLNKMLTAGEGGALLTRSPEWMERAVRYHDQGMFRDRALYGIDSSDETNAFVGQNFRMSELSGAVLLKQWEKLGGMLAVMRRHYERIEAELVAAIPSLRLRTIVDREGNGCSNLGIVCPDAAFAAAFNRALQAENINTYLLYNGKPVYCTPQILRQRTADKDSFPFCYPFRHPVVYTEDMCPTASDLLARTVFLPISPLLEQCDCVDIAAGMVRVYRTLSDEREQNDLSHEQDKTITGGTRS